MKKKKENSIGEFYKDEFEQLLTAMEFFSWAFSNLKGFVLNMLEHGGKQKIACAEWIDMFLSWSEYSEYLEYRGQYEK